MGFFGRKKDVKNTTIKSYAAGRSCLDCKHCDVKRAKNEQIYCKWDSEYYYPETGLKCVDFNK